MPTYEFRCRQCSNRFDVWATIAEKEKGLDLTCEKCGGKDLEQMFGGISFLTGSSSGKEGGFRTSGCDPSAGCC